MLLQNHVISLPEYSSKSNSNRILHFHFSVVSCGLKTFDDAYSERKQHRFHSFCDEREGGAQH